MRKYIFLSFFLSSLVRDFIAFRLEIFFSKL